MMDGELMCLYYGTKVFSSSRFICIQEAVSTEQFFERDLLLRRNYFSLNSLRTVGLGNC